MDEALSGADTQRSPEPGWYPDPVGRAAHRYWNGTEWTANTRGPAPVPAPGASGAAEPTAGRDLAVKLVPVPRPEPVEAKTASTPLVERTPVENTPVEDQSVGNAPGSSGPEASRAVEPESIAPRSVAPSLEQPVPVPATTVVPTTILPTTDQSAGRPAATELPGSQATGDQRSLFGVVTDQRSVAPQPESESGVPSPPIGDTSVPRQQSRPVRSSTPPPVAQDPAGGTGKGEGGSRRLASLLGALLIASAAFAGGLAVQRFVLDDSSSDAASTPTTLPPTTATPSTTTTEDTGETERLAAQLEAIEAELAVVTAERDEALATPDGETAALEAQIANLETHVDTMRSWFTTEILSDADAAFEAEIARACAADAEPTLDNTNYTNRMEPAGTHADIVAAALACRAGG